MTRLFERKTLLLILFVGCATAGFIVAMTLVDRTSGRQAQPDLFRESSVFDSVSDAEDFLGFEIAEPGQLPKDWRFVNILATKDLRTSEGSIVELHYDGPGQQSSLVVMQTPADIEPAVAGGNPRPVQVQGVAGTEDRGGSENPNLITITWRKSGMTYIVSAVTGGDLEEAQVMELMNSIR